MQKNAKNGTFFYKERKRTQWTERSFEKNGCPTLDFRSQNPKFCMHTYSTNQSFNFQKIPGGPNFHIFLCENWHLASFYNKEQTQKYKFEIWVLKTTILGPQKSVFLVFDEKFRTKFFSSWFCSDSALETIYAQMLKTH